VKTVTISDEAAAFLAKLAENIETQDARCTAAPYYFVVRCIKEISAPEGSTGETRYYDRSGGCSYTEEELRAQCKEDDEDFDDYVLSTCDKYDLQEIEEYENVFLTYEGYKQHMALNGHNYRHFKAADSYVKHAFRNPEMKLLVEAVKEIGVALKGEASLPVAEPGETANRETVGPCRTCGSVMCRNHGSAFIGQCWKPVVAQVKVSKEIGWALNVAKALGGEPTCPSCNNTRRVILNGKEELCGCANSGMVLGFVEKKTDA
jgi:quinol monooxygenase YgiN